MQYEVQPAKVPALSRTWEAVVTDRECGVVVARTVHTITLSRTAQGFEAVVDGQPATLKRANSLLAWAHDLKVISETLQAEEGAAA